jgi:chemotaxis protein methyltransferase CheR
MRAASKEASSCSDELQMKNSTNIPLLHDTQTMSRLREFEFGNEDFEALRKLVKQITGINLSDQKRELVYGRLARRLRALQLTSFAEYRDLLANDGGQEIVQFCNAITTNLTAFFREPHHFDYLRDHILAPMVDSNTPRRLRIWSAGCSTGEEPYSLAMTILETLPDVRRWDVRILATDLDSDVLERGRRGVYAEDRLKNLTLQRRGRFFLERRDRDGLSYEAAPELKSLITFKQLNLMHTLPMRGPLDAIFCRNVVIYFDKDTQRELFARVAQLQQPGNLLFLGHSESLFKVSEQYALIGQTVYRRA